MPDNKKYYVPPSANSLLSSLRGMGYSIETAIADIIDNSISANAKVIELVFCWRDNRNSYVQISDDGEGMSFNQLERAMRLGAISPGDHRRKEDLGRFGLGLKTASFSQCTRLTVATKSLGNGISCLRWDLNLLKNEINNDGWYVYEGPDPKSDMDIHSLDSIPHGTIVRLEDLDRFVTDNTNVDDFLKVIDRIEMHLSMIFHRLIGPNSLKININGKSIKPWDPFLTGHPSKAYISSLMRLNGCDDVFAQGHVLPHKDFLSDLEYKIAGGPSGWTAQQGFYIYRNKRLLVAGGWMGLGSGRSEWTRDEPHKLARIQLDIPNSVDEDWSIDVRKSKARPPHNQRLRNHLLAISNDIRERAVKVFVYRGQWRRKFLVEEDEVWTSERKNNLTRYKISRNSFVIKSFLEDIGNKAKKFEAILKIIEETVPIQKIWLNSAQDGASIPESFTSLSDDEVIDIMDSLFVPVINNKKYTKQELINKLKLIPPSDRYPHLIEVFLTKHGVT